jgi:hypothetical protein
MSFSRFWREELLDNHTESIVYIAEGCNNFTEVHDKHPRLQTEAVDF